jgi:hypothetical protein
VYPVSGKKVLSADVIVRIYARPNIFQIVFFCEVIVNKQVQSTVKFTLVQALRLCTGRRSIGGVEV